jgi:predicted nuclease of predicted toxin-antitoxin system
MRVLLDECLPRRLKRHLSVHETWTVPEAGWAGKKNGELLRAAAGKFEAFLTIDSNLSYQQNMTGLSFGVVVLSAPTNRLEDLLPLVPDILTALDALNPGQIVRVGG